MNNKQYDCLKQDLHNDNISWHLNVDGETLPGLTHPWTERYKQLMATKSDNSSFPGTSSLIGYLIPNGHP